MCKGYAAEKNSDSDKTQELQDNPVYISYDGNSIIVMSISLLVQFVWLGDDSCLRLRDRGTKSATLPENGTADLHLLLAQN